MTSIALIAFLGTNVAFRLQTCACSGKKLAAGLCTSEFLGKMFFAQRRLASLQLMISVQATSKHPCLFNNSPKSSNASIS